MQKYFPNEPTLGPLLGILHKDLSFTLLSHTWLQFPHPWDGHLGSCTQELAGGMKACLSPALGSFISHQWAACAWDSFQTHQQLWANPEHPLHFVIFSITLGWLEAEGGCFRQDGDRAQLRVLTSPSLPWTFPVMSMVWAIYLADSPFCQRFMPGHQDRSCCGNNSPSKLHSPFCTRSLR